MTAIRHTDLLSEEYVQGLVERLSSTDLQLEELKCDEGTPPSPDPSFELQRRYDTIADEILRQLINWHRDSFNVRFGTNTDDVEFLRSISTPQQSLLEDAQALKLKAQADFLNAKTAEMRGQSR
tara:strand:- start:251 stop:622 length:372 start_codon:yes stop_codon:yes gene_type:complete